jgi:hypothetical protein
MIKQDLLNKTFGHLTVIQKATKAIHNRYGWVCKCECGNTKISPAYNLINGLQISCGCSLGGRGLKLAGKRYNHFTVLNEVSKTCKKGHVRYWTCRCDCGKIKKINQNCLVNGREKSCGCQQFQKGEHHPCWTGIGEISGTFVKTIEWCARTRSLEFLITKEYIWDLFLKQNRKCAISGTPIRFSSGWQKTDGTASLDRIDSSKGYTPDNIQWVHKCINKMKMELPQSEFVNWCKLISEHQSTLIKID